MEGSPRFRQQFARDLRRHHRGYRDIVVPKGPVEEAVEEDPSDADASAIPNLQVTDTELNALQSRFLDVRRTPIDEFNRSQPLLTLAFPTLYPDGKADFVEPRLRSITFQDYLAHAMRWHDGRFARHKTWPFVALNTLLQEAMAEPDEPEAQVLIQSITRQAAELEAYAYNLGKPGLFATASAADYHWESLYRHMPRFDEWQTAPEAARMALSRQLLRDNAHIAAYHFHKRYALFRAIVLKQKFNLTDSWGRYEWGERNDGQINHYNRLLTVAWLANTDVSPCTSLQQVIDYAAKYCSKSEKKSESFAQIGKALMPRPLAPRPAVTGRAFPLLRIDGDEVDEAPTFTKRTLPSGSNGSQATLTAGLECWFTFLAIRLIQKVNSGQITVVKILTYLAAAISTSITTGHSIHPMANDVEVLGPHWRNTLNTQQRLVYDTFMGHFQAQNPAQILLHVDGGGGTGKSFLIKSRLRHIKYLVIDEKSMLGLEQLARIDSRLRQAFPQRNLEFFGGVSVVLVGDFFQLPPVRQKPLYSTSTGLSSLERRGQVAYRLFDRTVFLTTAQRQAGDDQAQFRQALQELRDARLPRSELDGFRTALRVYSTKARVNQYNHEHMVHLNAPAIQVEAKNHGNGAGQAPSNNAGNLSNKFPVAKGTRGTTPAVIMVDFDSYDGPPYLTTNEGRKISPHPAITDLATRDFQAGISYVAVSRVTSLQGLLLEAPFDRQSLYNHTPTEGMKMRLADQQRRQGQQLSDPLYPPLYRD
ncbi:PIF1-like helicase [Hirsutella rhossiliensis]